MLLVLLPGIIAYDLIVRSLEHHAVLVGRMVELRRLHAEFDAARRGPSLVVLEGRPARAGPPPAPVLGLSRFLEFRQRIGHIVASTLSNDHPAPAAVMAWGHAMRELEVAVASMIAGRAVVRCFYRFLTSGQPSLHASSRRASRKYVEGERRQSRN
jgi:hypothetical protein